MTVDQQRDNFLSTFNLGEFVLALSWALDLANPTLHKHATRVAAMAYQLGQQICLTESQLSNIVFAALLHDAGISSSEMKLRAADFDIGEDAQQHCIEGFHLFKDSEPLYSIAPLIGNHHIHRENIPEHKLNSNSPEMIGNLLHIADRTEISIDRDEHVLLQKDAIEQRILSNKGRVFDPELVERFLRLSERESFWLNIESGKGAQHICKLVREHNFSLTLPQLRDLASIFASIIDRKSPFTFCHSHGVAETAVELASHMGFSRPETLKIGIAGLLHDLGKLSIPDSILEKPGELTKSEWRVMKQHSYYTHFLLSDIESLEDIAAWSALHHEKLDGSGYPFGLSAGHLPLEARIIAVSDIHQSLREDRPYRPAKPQSEAYAILDDMARNSKIDSRIVATLKRIKPVWSRPTVLHGPPPPADLKLSQ